ncbi:hypothetical protein HanRHA438_Chr08g0334901 [Helianthus annuus]|nr:hypothetical protein HanRHA438_Chr08g0334901 [Helianthus annuus]
MQECLVQTADLRIIIHVVKNGLSPSMRSGRTSRLLRRCRHMGNRFSSCLFGRVLRNGRGRFSSRRYGYVRIRLTTNGMSRGCYLLHERNVLLLLKIKVKGVHARNL